MAPEPLEGPDPRIDLEAIRARVRSTANDAGLVAAGLLLAIDRGPLGDRILLTRRCDGLRDHPGEICLPGGKRRPGDRDLAATALREAREEVGVEADEIEPIAALDDVVVGGRFVATTLVALARVRTPLRADPAEVAEAFWVDVRDLRAPGVSTSRTDEQGMVRYRFALRDVTVVGATARILHQALDPVAAEDAAALAGRHATSETAA